MLQSLPGIAGEVPEGRRGISNENVKTLFAARPLFRGAALAKSAVLWYILPCLAVGGALFLNRETQEKSYDSSDVRQYK